jgi:isoquinoline 1-oxidoreductase beta subunit
VSSENPTSASRRAFLTGTGGLVVAASLPLRSRAQSGAAHAMQGDGTQPEFAPNAFIRVGEDDTVTVLIKHIEFGQGPWTGLATLVADEMDADWSQIRAEHAPADVKLYANAAFGLQGTGGSTAMAVSFELMRKAGAAARAMLVAAAARAWGVAAADIDVHKGVLSHAASGRSGGFGTFARLATTEPAPENPILKTPDQFVYIGKDVPKLDTAPKTNGEAVFSLDVFRDDMLTVVVAHPTRIGAKVAEFDDSAARQVTGVAAVKQLSSGVAVYGESTWAALMGLDALEITWDDSAAETRSSAQIEAAWLAAVRSGRGTVAGAHGDVDTGLSTAVSTVEAEYTFPYLAHAPMEPLDGVIELGNDGAIDVWMGSQLQTVDQNVVATVCGVTPDRVRIHTMLAGGSFGRRAQPTSHFAQEAAEAFMAIGGERPVKLMWTREDDIQGGYYRPLMAHRVRAGLDANGDIIAWEHVIAGQSIMAGSPFAAMIRDGIDPTMVEGASELPYVLPNVHVSAHTMDSAVSTLWWRSVGHTHTGYAVETFLDELLEQGGKDPVAGRLALMQDKSPRLGATLERVARLAAWGREPAPGHAFGVAAVESFGSYVSQIADVSMGDNGMPVVHKVWCVVDCGIAVNPEVIKAQMEGGIGFGLGAVLHNEVRLAEGGEVAQTNFHTYPSLRIDEMPEVEVEIMPSDASPTGVGEPGVPPIGPAVANAVRRLTGRTPRMLPMKRSLKA